MSENYTTKPGDAKVLSATWRDVTGGDCDPAEASKLVEQFGLGAVLGAIEPAYQRWRKQGKGKRPFTWGWVWTQLQQPAIVAKFQAQPAAVLKRYWRGTLEQRAHQWWSEQGKDESA